MHDGESEWQFINWRKITSRISTVPLSKLIWLFFLADARSSMRLKPKSMNLSFINSKLIEASFFRLEIYPKFLLVKSESRDEPYQ